jgi:PKD repeat protein
MKYIIVACFSCFLFSAAFTQANGPTVEEKRESQRHLGVRQGEEVEYCSTHWKRQEMMEKHPALKALYEKRQRSLDKEYKEFLADRSSNPEAKAGVVYTIPVVFHVLHQNTAENISYDQVVDAVSILNRDFRLNNADAGSVQSSFSGMPADAEIEFALATIAPNGDCFNGVTRTYSYYTYLGNDGSDQIQAVIDGNDVYNGNWPGDEYLNIYVAVDIGGAAGYTTNPGWSGTGMGNGIWIQHGYVGTIGTGSVSRSRSLTHEVGHWLNLDHCWGPSNNPGIASNCGDDDDVNDTPECIGVTSCLLLNNSCSGDNSYWGFNQIDNVENYMEYSYCSKMYTQGQVDRMRVALTSSAGGRNNIWKAANLAAVGADVAPTELCKADFNVDKYELCAGDAVQFEDLSFNNVTGWSWTFPGGSPSSSTAQHPNVIYSTPGSYSVTLEASNGSGFVTTTKAAYIIVMPNTGRSAPYSEGFESIWSLPHPEWFVESQDGQQWQVGGIAAATGSRSVWIDNSTPNSATDDSFISNTINLGYATSAELSFKYAFARRETTNTDKLEVWASANCGESWALRKNISSAVIGTAPEQSGNFVPSPSQWEEVTVTNINSTYWTPRFRFKIVYVGGGGNNIYLDDINLDAVLGVSELDLVRDFNIYPNPFNNEANVEFNLLKASDINVQMFDMVGKLLKSDRYKNMAEGNHVLSLDASGLATGVYTVKLKVAGTELTRKVAIH